MQVYKRYIFTVYTVVSYKFKVYFTKVPGRPPKQIWKESRALALAPIYSCFTFYPYACADVDALLDLRSRA